MTRRFFRLGTALLRGVNDRERPSYLGLVTSLLLLLCCLPSLAADLPKRQWIVVTAPAYREAIEPLCKQREKEKFRVVVVQTTDVLAPKDILAGDAEKLRKRIRQLCKEFAGTSYVLVVGAVEAGQLAEPEKKVLPPLRGSTGRMKGQPSDNGFGCLDDNLEPSVAVGRFPAHSVKEVEGLVHKTLAFETDTRPGDWRRRITVLAGVPAFNPLVDRLVERLAMARFSKLDPVWIGQAIYHTETSRFCVPDDKLEAQALKYVEAGQAFTLYLGHSNPEGLYAPGTRFLNREDWGKLHIARGQGIFGTFGCNGCQLSGEKGEGYGLFAIRNPNGPVAVVGSHGICFAAMVQLATDGLFRGFGDPPAERLGELWLQMKAGIARGAIDPRVFDALDAVDGDSDIPQATQRLEHLEMFVLLGDPALRLPVMKADIKLTANEAKPGATFRVQVELPERLRGASVQLTLERPINSEPTDLEPLPDKPADIRAQVMLANHERANRFVIARREIKADKEHNQVEIGLPAKLPWPKLTLRAYAVRDELEGMAVLVVPVQKP